MTTRPKTAKAAGMTSSDMIAPKPAPHIIVLMLCTMINPLAINIFLPSMPGIADEFGVPYATIQLGLSLYLATTAFITLAAGPLSDIYGRRPLIVAGFILFMLGTILTVIAQNAFLFLLGRVIQAAAATGMVLTRAIIRDLYDRDMAASMIGYVTMGMAVAPMIGPAIGGVLDDLYGWRSSFIFLGLLGAMTFWILWQRLPETNSAKGQPLARQIESYRSLLGSSEYWIYAFAAITSAAVFFSFLGGGPAIASEFLEMSPTGYGLWFAICAFGYMLGNFMSGRFSVSIGTANMILTGAITAAIGATLPLIFLYFLGWREPVALFGPTILIGIGNGMTLPNAIAAAVSIRPDSAGAASGLMGALQVAGGAAASVVAGIMAGDGTNVSGFGLTLMIFGLMGLFAAILAFRKAHHI